MLNQNETIAAIATAPGPAGVAVVRVSGPEAFAVATRLTRGRFAPPSGGLPCARVCALFPTSQPPKLSKPPNLPNLPPLDTAVVLAFRAPHSYTGEDVVEFQCHGGAVTPRRVLEACFAAGARLARRGEFTERAFLNGKLDYDQAESVLDLIQAKTARAADAALDGLAGRRARAHRALYDRALDLSSELEHALDIDEGELPDSFFASLRTSLAALDAALGTAATRVRAGRILRDGARVVLAGPPNAGKSSLLNALLEENRALVSDVPGTTRDSVEAWLDLDGWPIRLVDTAGLRETEDALEAAGVKRAEKLIAEADIVIDLSGEPSVRSTASLASLSALTSPASLTSLTSETASPTLLPIHPKCDLGRGEGLNVSAKTGEGLGELRRAIVAALERRAASAASEGASDAPDDRALSALCAARAHLTPLLQNVPLDLVLAGNAVRAAAESLGALVGATYSSDLLDSLFSRFCVGK